MLKLIDLNYHMHADISETENVLELQKASIGFTKFIKEKLEIQFVKHLNYEGEKIIDGIKYKFFKSRNKFFYIPFKTNRYVKKQQPDIVLIPGFIFPVQIIALRLMLNKHTKIIVQHRGGSPFKGIKKMFQKIADKFIDRYIFTSFENSDEWIKNKIISNKQKCFEVLGASTYFRKKDKELCKKQLLLTGVRNFLWVSRLNAGKDPLTVLRAFEKYATFYPDARLYFIYQTNELLPEIKNLLIKNETLKNSVILQGKVLHRDLETWYSAADFYISGSHKESTGFSLLEAMACGCVPIVTSIPSFNKITDNGKYGFLFDAGNDENLLDILLKTENADREKLSAKIIAYFENSLSFKSIADNLYKVCKKLISE